MKKSLIYTIILAMFLPLMCSGRAFALAKQAEPDYTEGDQFVPGQLIVVMCDGPVYYCSSGSRSWEKMKNGQTVMHGDGIRTLEHGYAVLSWEANNLVFVKPNSSIRTVVSPEPQGYKLQLQLFVAELMISARDACQVSTESRFGSHLVTLGDSSVICDDNQMIVRSAKGLSSVKLAATGENITVPEGYALEIESTGQPRQQYQFNITTEYDNYKRFDKWLKRFERLHKMSSNEVAYRVDSVKINGTFLSNMQTEDGLYVIETEDKRVPKNILFQFKLTPVAPPTHRFELSISKDLVYAVREGRDDYYEVNFALPSIPEFFVTVNQIDSLGRRVRIFNAGFSVFNKRFAELRARNFCKEMSEAVTKRDQIWFRKNISEDYRDWQGNTWTDFSIVSDRIMRQYRDIRFMIHPFRFEFRKNETLVHVNYRLTALTSDWKFRFEDKGADIYTLKVEEGVLKLKSKTSGMFFNRMKTALDLRKSVLKGRITDEYTGYPIEGVRVNVVGTSYTAVTDSMGEYVIYNMEPGKYNITFSKNGYGNLTASSVTLRPAGEYSVK